jgi:hypothetical protein
VATVKFDAHEFNSFSKAMRLAAPDLKKHVRSRIGKAGRALATKMRAEMPHKEHAGGIGIRAIRFSDAISTKGGAIIVGGHTRPLSYAYAFGVGQKGRIGFYKHPTYGRWPKASGPNKGLKNIMPISDYVWRNWEEGKVGLRLEAEAALQETIEQIAYGTAESNV